jgi:exonuclease VII large subunit
MLAGFLAALLLAPPAAAEVPLITPDQAKDHVGQEVVAEGQVAQIGASERSHTLFVNFGGRYPNHVFTAVIFSRNLSSLPEARSWEGKTIKVRGQVQLHQGKPEIVLERGDQVTVVNRRPGAEV